MLFRSESINIESEKVGISSYSPKLKDYFEAFSRDDKDTEKMIQAGGYAYSFVQCLKKLQPERFKIGRASCRERV